MMHVKSLSGPLDVSTFTPFFLVCWELKVNKKVLMLSVIFNYYLSYIFVFFYLDVKGWRLIFLHKKKTSQKSVTRLWRGSITNSRQVVGSTLVEILVVSSMGSLHVLFNFSVGSLGSSHTLQKYACEVIWETLSRIRRLTEGASRWLFVLCDKLVWPKGSWDRLQRTHEKNEWKLYNVDLQLYLLPYSSLYLFCFFLDKLALFFLDIRFIHVHFCFSNFFS